jgi:hypothetical protein
MNPRIILPSRSENQSDAQRLHVDKSSLPGQTAGPGPQVFTLTLGTETIELVPFKNWGQLDLHKWVARGKLPASPAGLEVASDHVKVAGESVSIQDPQGCSKLERVLNEWIALEQGTLELAKSKAAGKAVTTPLRRANKPEPQTLRYCVELDVEGQVHIRCLQGKQTIAEAGLSAAGLNSLVSQGVMHKPKAMKVGALHDWVELDGVLFSFEKGNNDAVLLEQALNEKYLSSAALGQGKEIVAFTNAASSTGFDLLFTVTVGGTPDRRRRPLNEETLELLQDQHRCGALHKNLVVKLTRPSLIFKQKTSDGGEQYLLSRTEHKVTVVGDDGQQKIIDLSQPVNYMHLSAVELTTILNHPAINQHSQPVVESGNLSKPADPELQEPISIETARWTPDVPPPVPSVPLWPLVSSEPVVRVDSGTPPLAVEAPVTAALPEPETASGPNVWLEEILDQAPADHEWLTRLVYYRLVQKFGNSRESQFGPIACSEIALSDIIDASDPAFHGIFLTAKGGLGFLNQEHQARFQKGVLIIGTGEEAFEGIDVKLLAMGLDCRQRFVFIVSDNYLTKFGVPESAVIQELGRLKMYGAIVASRQEILASSDPIEVVWTVPAEELNVEDPAVIETQRPEPEAGDLVEEDPQELSKTA